MQNVPGGQSSSSGGAGYASHTTPATHQNQPATSLGQQPGDNTYFSSVVVDPTAALQCIDPVNINQTLIGYPTTAAPPHVIVTQQPNQFAYSWDAYQARVEVPEHLFLNHAPMVPIEVAGPPAPNYGAYEGYSPERQNRATLRCKWEGCAYSGTFNRTQELLRHVKNIHVSPQSYQCDTCGQRFNQSYNREVHMRRHRMRGVSRG